MKNPPSPDAIRQLAEQIAADLLVGVGMQVATNLRHFNGDRNLGCGWSREAVIDRIEAHLRNAAVEMKEKGGG